MDLQTGKLYWPTTHPDAPKYPKLDEDINCDILIIGAGSSGAACAHYLANTDLDIVVIDKKLVGRGSTSANTALIQYIGDKTFTQLSNSFGEEKALQHILNCQNAIKDIKEISKDLPIDPQYTVRDSAYFASCKEDLTKLDEEYALLKKYKLDVEYLTQSDIENKFPFSRPGAIYFYNDGELNPYVFNIGLLKRLNIKRNLRIYENTEVKGRKVETDSITFHTTDGYSIKAKKVILAAGYECMDFKKDKNVSFVSSYAVVTNPVDDFSRWYKRALIWETARPYIYMRTTSDDRVIIGGLDENTTCSKERDAKIPNKKQKLIKEFNKLFPNINVTPEYYLGAFYGGTHDGLPMIGIYDELPHCYLMMGYGDNGLVYNMALARILSEVITEGNHKNLKLYLKN